MVKGTTDTNHTRTGETCGVADLTDVLVELLSGTLGQSLGTYQFLIHNRQSL